MVDLEEAIDLNLAPMLILVILDKRMEEYGQEKWRIHSNKKGEICIDAHSVTNIECPRKIDFKKYKSVGKVMHNVQRIMYRWDALMIDYEHMKCKLKIKYHPDTPLDYIPPSHRKVQHTQQEIPYCW